MQNLVKSFHLNYSVTNKNTIFGLKTKTYYESTHHTI